MCKQTGICSIVTLQMIPCKVSVSEGLGKAQEQSKMLTGLMTVLFFYFISLHFRTRNIEIISQSQVKDMVDYLPVFFSCTYVKGRLPGAGGNVKERQ